MATNAPEGEGGSNEANQAQIDQTLFKLNSHYLGDDSGENGFMGDLFYLQRLGGFNEGRVKPRIRSRLELFPRVMKKIQQDTVKDLVHFLKLPKTDISRSLDWDVFQFRLELAKLLEMDLITKDGVNFPVKKLMAVAQAVLDKAKPVEPVKSVDQGQENEVVSPFYEQGGLIISRPGTEFRIKQDETGLVARSNDLFVMSRVSNEFSDTTWQDSQDALRLECPPDETLQITLADGVSGGGLFTRDTAIRAVFHSQFEPLMLTGSARDPQQMLDRSVNLLGEWWDGVSEAEKEMAQTTLLGVKVDTKTGEVVYGGIGEGELFIVKAYEEVKEFPLKPGKIGPGHQSGEVNAGLTYLLPGDTLVVATDGLTHPNHNQKSKLIDQIKSGGVKNIQLDRAGDDLTVVAYTMPERPVEVPGSDPGEATESVPAKPPEIPPVKVEPSLPMDRESIRKRELIYQQEREGFLIRAATQQGESVLYTRSTIPSTNRGPGFQFVTPEWSYVDVSEQGPDYWKQIAFRLLGNGAGRDDNSFREPCLNYGVNEVVVIRALDKPIMENRKVNRLVEKKGILGMKKQVEQEFDELQEVGRAPVTVKEAALPSSSSNDQTEAACLHYLATDWADKNPQISYDSGSGAGGNVLDFKLILPKELATNLAAETKTNPTFVRDLVFAVIKQRYPRIFNTEVINKYGTPPYAGWEKQRGSTAMYMVDTLSDPNAKSGLENFDTNRVIRFKTSTTELGEKNNYTYATGHDKWPYR